jgi:hypothetical protein
MRTVCHGCRVMRYRQVTMPDGTTTRRAVVSPGNGTIATEVTGTTVRRPCPVCGDSDDPGWVPGFSVPA